MSISLTYFDFDGSRGLECRLALAAAGVQFNDIRVATADWPALKPKVPFGAMPVLTVDGKALAQSLAILGYVGRQYGLHPADLWAAAEHEALMQSVEDLRAKLPDIKKLPDADKKPAREAFANGWLQQWAQTVNDRIRGPFLEGDKLHVADLKLYVILRGLLGNTFDFVPASALDAYPKVLALFAAVDAHPAVRGYFAARP